MIAHYLLSSLAVLSSSAISGVVGSTDHVKQIAIIG